MNVHPVGRITQLLRTSRVARYATTTVAALGLVVGPAGVASAAPSVTPASVPSAILQSASFTFNTQDDDKDGDTQLRLEVLDNQNHVVAIANGTFGLFKDQSQNGPIPLRVRGGITEGSLVGGHLDVLITPNGNDTWKFDGEVDINFDSDFQFTTFGRTVLSQSNRELNLPLDIF
jgi:hypothetical protein